jgi:purine catabolism regulator
MSLPTLRELLALPAFSGAEVLAGESRLDGEVTWVHVSELMDAGRLLSGGELLLSTGLELARGTKEARETYVRSLADAGAQGLALELVQWMSEVPAEVLASARLLGLPLLVFRQEVRFAELSREALELILRPRMRVSREDWLETVADSLDETGRASTFVEGQLGPLLALPARPRRTLLATVEALVGCNFNMTEAARKLGVRRQSLYYRLEQLNGMLGDLDPPLKRSGLLVALELLKRSLG